MKVIGLVPARMASSRFPGKPLYPILGKPMIEHVLLRAQLYGKWDHLALTTCDQEIQNFGISKGFKVVMTSDQHTRCLDRVAEAAPKLVSDIAANDVVVCVQGDEPMLYPDMIDAAVKPLLADHSVNCTVLAMDILDEKVFRHKDTVKIVHNLKGDVLYTSRSPIPWCEKLTPEVGAKRIYGIFAFRWQFLKEFTNLPESPLEIVESCDSNRLFDNSLKQRIAPYPFAPSYSVDNPADILTVEAAMKLDPILKEYM
jgi:3-deoxy-manno-octulosonate cytidylyltransferase (CMP-KDO synthetase)